MKHIVFLFPGSASTVTGGVKVVLEYANKLANDGYYVSLVYPASIFFRKYSLKIKARALVRYIYNILTKHYSCRKWFSLNPKVQEKWVWCLEENFVPHADTYIATGIQTSVYLNNYRCDVAKKYYFVQGFEDWVDGFNSREKVIETYYYPMQKIVVSAWLKRIMDKIGQSAVVIPNGFDFNKFYCKCPINKRNPISLAMLYHKVPAKGCSDGIKAITYVKKKYSELKVTFFGVYDRPTDLPEWITYIKTPSQNKLNDIYNDSAIFVAPSHNEGWGLTVGEAMMCGCAVVCTDTKGHLEMAKNRENSIVVPIKNHDMMADAIIELVENDCLREKLAIAGMSSIRRFDCNNSYKQFVELFS